MVERVRNAEPGRQEIDHPQLDDVRRNEETQDQREELETVWVQQSTTRLLTRSATAPPSGARNRRGTNCAAKTNPTAVPLSPSRRTSTANATVCIHVPDTETSCPAMNSRKLRTRSAKNVRRPRSPLTAVPRQDHSLRLSQLRDCRQFGHSRIRIVTRVGSDTAAPPMKTTRR